MRNWLVAIVLGSTSLVASAQSYSPEAVRLGGVFADSSWKTMQTALPLMLSGMEVQVKCCVAESSAKVLSKHILLKISRENLSKVMAQQLTNKLTPDELKELDTFLESETGKKYLSISSDETANKQAILPLFREACQEAMLELSPVESGKLGKICKAL